jgi:TolB-like protein
LAWGRSELARKIIIQLSRSQDLRPIHANSTDQDELTFPVAEYNIDSLLEWGREIGGHYLLVVYVTSERLERTKTFTIPLIVHQWETIAVIEGEVRLLDLGRGRLLWADPFREELSARRIIQADQDNTRADADLHVPAYEKQVLFSELEEILADKLARRVRTLARSR